MKVVIYARYSCDRQTEQSIEGQMKVCREYAERNDYKVIDEYIDRALTGTSDNRPEFLRMISDSAKRQFQGIIVYQLDRFARNRYDSATYKAKLKKNGVKVLSARENISDDASGVLMEAVLEGMAEYFSAELSQKVKRGMELMALKGEYTGSVVPLGYKIVDKKFVIDTETAPIVKRIFEMYLNRKTMADIIRYLNESRIKSSMGNPFSKNSIRVILTNKKYIGLYKYKDIEIPGGVPQIIDDITFKEAQIQMQKNKKAPARGKAIGESYLLTTKLFCGHCEKAITGVSGTSRNGNFHQYYACTSQKKREGCKKKPLRKNMIEDLVVTEILSLLTDEKIDSMARSISELSLKEGNTTAVKRLKKLLKENEDAIENLVNAIESGKAVDLLSSQIEKRQSEREDLESQLAQELLLKPVLDYDTVKFFFEKFNHGDVTDTAFRMTLIDTLINKILIFEGENARVEIYCHACEMPLEVQLKSPLDITRKGSSKRLLAPQVGLEPTTLRLTAACSTN